MKHAFILLMILSLLCSCTVKEPENILQEQEPGKQVLENEEENPAKIFLPLMNFWEGDGLDIDTSMGTEISGRRVDIPFATPEGIDEYNHSAIKTEIPPELENEIRKGYPDFEKESWEAILSYFTSDFSVGIIKMNYLIGDKIVTNKAVVCTLENGKIVRINYTNMDMYIDETYEDELLEKVKNFEATTVQTGKTFEEDEEFLSEDIQYNYYYNIDTLVYTYQLFFYVGTGEGRVVNNDYGCEYIIE